MAKGKSGKKEKERKKREEEERKQRELLDAAQDDAEKNKEKLKESGFEHETRRLEALKLQEQQRQTTKEKINAFSKNIEEIRRDQWNSEAWARYMSCDGRPNLEDRRQLNSYVSRWMDQKGGRPKDILIECDDAVLLREDLQSLLYKGRHLPLDVQEACYEATFDLQNCIRSKMDQATLELLKEASMVTDPETGNSYFYDKNQAVELSVWSNLSCNSRYNGIDAKEIGVAFSIPRSIVITECAVRIMKMSVDHLSPRCRTYSSLSVPVFSDHGTCSHYEITKEMSRNEEQEGGGVVSDDVGVVDLNDYFILGSIISIDLLRIPPQPRNVKRWIITKLEEPDELQYVCWLSDYVSPSELEDAEGGVKKEDEELEKEQERANEELKRLVYVTIKLPSDVLLSDIPKLARWDATIDAWTSSTLYQVLYKEDQNSVSFYADRFGTFSLMQSRFTSFPYQSWELIPIGKSKVSFSIASMAITIEITIEIDQCVLDRVLCNEKPFREADWNKSMTVLQLFKWLQSAGIYFTPKRNDHLYTSNIKLKNKPLEDGVYRQMAMASSSVVFSYSRWNANVGHDKIVLRSRNPEQPSDKGKQPVIFITHDAATVLNITELSQTFSETASNESPISADLYHAVFALGSESVREALNEIDLVFVDTVFQVLATVRVLRC